jgi:hypothetical protein
MLSKRLLNCLLTLSLLQAAAALFQQWLCKLHLAGKNQQISLEGWMARKNISNKKCKIWRGLGLA